MTKKQKMYSIMVVLLLIAIFMTHHQPFFAAYQARYDDALIVEQASSIRSGDWLGKYHDRTLIKGPLTSMLLAFTSFFHLSFFDIQILIYGLVCFFLIQQLKHWISNSHFLILLYGMLLFSPIFYSASLLRLYRDGIYSSLVLLLLGFLFHWYLHRNSKKEVFSMLGLGITTALILLCREEGIILLLPFLICFFVIRTPRVSSYLVLGMSFLSIVIPISLWNYHYYQTYKLNDYIDSSFRNAYSALVRVESGYRISKVPVSKATMQEIRKESASFDELSSFFFGEKGASWERLDSIEGEIGGAYFFWALRQAVALEGYYDTPKKAEEYYQRLTLEINQACQEGRLLCMKKSFQMLQPFTWKDFSSFGESFFKIIKFQVQLDGIEIKIPASGIPSNETLEQSFRVAYHPIATETSYDTSLVFSNRQFLSFLKTIYSFLNPIFLCLSLFAYVGLWYFYVSQKIEVRPYLFLLTLILFLYLGKIVSITYTYTFAYETACNSMYLASTYALQFLFSWLALFFFYVSFKHYLTSKKKNAILLKEVE